MPAEKGSIRGIFEEEEKIELNPEKYLYKRNFVLNLHPHYSNGPWCNWQHVWFWSRRV